MAKEGAQKTQKQPAPKSGTKQAPPSQPKESLGLLKIDFYYDQYYLLAFISFMLLVISSGCVLWAVYEKTLQNVPNQGIPSPIELKDSEGTVVVAVGDPTLKFPTTPDGKLVYPTPLSEPSMPIAALLEWGVRAVSDSYTFNFINFDQIITNSSIFYTKAGYQNYRRTLVETNIANNVDKKKYVLQVIPVSAPNILKESITPSGAYSWLIQFPIRVMYRNLRETQTLEFIVTMAIQRVPLSESPDGVAIAALIVRETKLSL